MSIDKNKAMTGTDKPTTVVIHDIYYVVIMIDASHPKQAFVELKYAQVNHSSGKPWYKISAVVKPKIAHDPVAMPGHALHYVVKNNTIQAVLSFGPDGKVAAVYGQGTPDCTMKNMVYAFRYDVGEYKAKQIIQATQMWREKIISGKEKYAGITNDTCAETTLQVLRPYIDGLPKGEGLTTKSISENYAVPAITAITPYWLFEDLKKLKRPYKVHPKEPTKYTIEDPKKLKFAFVPKAGEKDTVEW